jgi:CSLREA domain-containing protein
MNRQRSASLVLAAVLVMASGPNLAHNLRADFTLATIVVNSTADVAADDGQCTLREAIVAANTDTASGAVAGECAAGNGGDMVDLNGITGTITLTSPLPSITSDIIFSGPGSSHLTVWRDSLSGTYRIFTVDAGATATISGLTISNGSVMDGVGGGIYDAGTLTLVNSTVISNEARLGGGIGNFGMLTLAGSTVAGNDADDGGGIYNMRTLTLTNSTLISNEASFRGGGIFNYFGCTTELGNSTIGGNQATSSGGGIYNGGGTLTLEDSTVSGNTAAQGGGIDTNWGTVELINSTISDNQATFGGGGIASVGDTSYIGTLTLTHSTVSGNSAGCGGGILNDFNSVAELADSVVCGNDADDGGGGIYNAGALALADSTVSDNDTSTTIVVSGHGGGIYNAITGTLTLNTSLVSNNAVFNTAHDGYGGGIYNAGTLAVNNSIVLGNDTYGDHCHGGGIHNEGTLTLNDSTVRGNNASANGSYGDGGGIHNVGSGSSATLSNCTVSSNESLGGGSGGGLWNSDGANMQLSNSTVTSNWSSNNGGGINNTGNSTVTLANSTIGRHNFASGSGGGMWNDSGGTVNLKNSIVAGNGANSAGPDCHNTATLTSLDYNLVGDDSGCSFTPQTNDQVNVDPLLGDLQDNGGPTETRALLDGSPAIDAIPIGSCTDHHGRPVTTDQRGVNRPQGAACDVGAYEAVHSALHLPLVVYNYTPSVTFPLYVGDAIPERDVTCQGEVFYTTSVQIPGELPSGGHFYFSSRRDTLAEVMVDDELVVLLDGAEVFAYDFSTSGTPMPAAVEVPRTTMEQLAGWTVRIEYRDVYGSVVGASTMWLIWAP